MDVVLVASDPDRAEAIDRAAVAEGHRVVRLPHAFNKAVEAMNSADVVVADFAGEVATASWCLAYALARARLAVACAPPQVALPTIVRDNPSPYQRIIVGTTADIERGLRELLHL